MNLFRLQPGLDCLFVGVAAAGSMFLVEDCETSPHERPRSLVVIDAAGVRQAGPAIQP
jgi:hypothetical protein